MVKTGVVLLNMGGPEQLADVQPFLYNLFSDRDIIRLGPPFLQKPIAWYISRKRAPKSRKLYQHIGGSSPLTKITFAQASALAGSLEEQVGQNTFVVTVAMRYWQPDADKALEELIKEGVKRIIVLPLYPHYSRATSGSSIADFNKALQSSELSSKLDQPPVVINSFHDNPRYIDCLAQRINKALQEKPTDTTRVIYSAHSLPTSFIKEGDPYVDHLEKTISEVEQITQTPGTLCYQSRSGPVEWLSPSTSETLEELAQSGCKNVIVVPISFVSDHLETLYEIDIMFKEEAEQLGMQLMSTEGLNTSEDFIDCLAELVLGAAEKS